MRSTWNPKPGDLDRFASDHVEYEVRMLLQQSGHLDTRWADVQAGKRPDLGSDGHALLEAVLVHLRLLDDFLGDRRQTQSPVSWWRLRRRRRVQDDVFARHWNRAWRPARFLTRPQRMRVNAQLAHLSARRLTAGWNVQPGELAGMVEECCRRLDEFFTSLHPQRLAAFKPASPLPPYDAPTRVDDYLRQRAARKWAT